MRNLMKTALVMVALILTPLAASADDGKMRLFVNLTTDDTWSAAKAIMFAHQKAHKNGHDAAIWLNVRGVYLADKKRPSNVPGLMAKDGTSIQNMLTAFIADGGTVIMCSACTKAAGLTEADYIDGIVMGNTDLVAGWLFDENTQTLAW
mgnify:CR=1 FL=1